MVSDVVVEVLFIIGGYTFNMLDRIAKRADTIIDSIMEYSTHVSIGTLFK